MSLSVSVGLKGFARVMFMPARVWLKGSSRVMSLLVFPLLGDRVGLKGLIRLMPLPSSVLVSIPLYAAYSLTFAQDLEDRDIFFSFGVINTSLTTESYKQIFFQYKTHNGIVGSKYGPQ